MPTLAAILGQDHARSILARALASGKLPHALLFVGPAGVGKATTAVAVALALNCEARPGEGCHACGACEKIATGIHPDVLRIVPGGAGNVISIEAIRDLTSRLGFAPHEGRARVVVVEDADRMGIEASNAFLKTLEEPPPRTFFVLCSSAPDRLLVTIQSRCQRVRFAPLADDAIATLLERGGVDAARAREVAPLAGGSAARAAELADGDALERRRARARVALAAVRGGGWKSAIDAASELAATKEDLGPTLELLATWYRDAAAVASGLGADQVHFADSLDELRAEAARGGGPAALARRAAAVLDAQQALLGYANPQLTLERMLLVLREDQR